MRLLSWPELWRRRGEAAMNTVGTDCPIRQKQGQTLILRAHARRVTFRRCLGWLRFWRWYAGGLPVARRHRAPPRLGNGKQGQQSATADCLDLLTQERPSL